MRSWTAEDHQTVLRGVAEPAGLVFPASATATTARAVRRSVERSPARTAAGFLEWIAGRPAERDRLLTDLTVGESYFFRDPAQVEVIRTRVVPRFQATGTPIRAWSAGCATGEEAYTLAILLREAGIAAGSVVVGTDIARERLSRARAGCYSRWSLRGVPRETVRRYFRRQGSRFELREEIRAMAAFRPLNLAEASYPSTASGIWGMDLILCRNVLIYLDRGAVARIAARLLEALSEEGWLFLGASDPPLSDLVPCEVVLTESGVAYRRRRESTKIVPVPGLAAPSPPLPAARARAPAQPPARPRPPKPSEEGLADARESPEYESVMRVRALADRGDLIAAGTACAAALDVHRHSAELTYLQALLLGQAGHHRAAADAARRALYLDPSLVPAHLELASALHRLEDPAGARRSFRNAERLLAGIPGEAVVAGSAGETAGRLLQLARARLRFLAPERER